MDTVSFEEFKKLNIRVCRILEVKDHPDADKLYILEVDIGGEKREAVAGLKAAYKPEELQGKLVAFVENIAPATIRGVESKGMVLAAQDDKKIVVLSPEKDIAPGSKVK